MATCKSCQDKPIQSPPSHHSSLRDLIPDNQTYVAAQNNLWKEPHSTDEPQVIYCKFVNDHPNPSYDARIKSFVQEWVKDWELYAFIHFKFVAKEEPAHIRIKFGQTEVEGAWSAIGNDSVAANSPEEKKKLMLSVEPSMLFGDFSADPNKMPEDVPDDQIYHVGVDCARTTVLHEFGHALGLHHEHASPKALFVWAADKLGNNNYQMVTGSPGDEINVSAFDMWSIMRYPLAEKDVDWDKSRGSMNDHEWLKFKQDLQIRPIRLSEGDKVWAITAYPGRNHPELEAARAKWAGTIQG
ncbi:hypothetical protein QBC38DRAFT_226297 [Podospora fimiseda]|uniref:Peptidase M10 metallopeptidase domain-containing protein n=1 Tax=Podospora fimiseda TaxID=252190 RepID=A0AAN7BY39_9PEZI|nr:hypothetical protein QBC38DRAFT_226297 [Podospora fimiseda]